MFDKRALLIPVIIWLVCMSGPTYAIGLGSYGPSQCRATNAAEVYCSQHGGCARDGYCFFPDGSYCELWSFYNGTCPGKAYYEQMMWEREAYNFLHGDEGYYPSSMQYPSSMYYPSHYYPPYYSSGLYGNYYNYNWPIYGPYLSDPLYPAGW